MAIFININPKFITDAIHSAKSRVIYAAPALDEAIASALINTAKKIGYESVSVLLDISENVFRCGYGNIDGVTLLNEEGISIKDATGIRIGVLICDNEGLIFSLPPQLIEAGSKEETHPNGMRVNLQQINEIISAILPKEKIDNNLNSKTEKTEIKPVESEIIKKLLPDDLIQEIGKSEVSLEKIQNIEKALTDNPPQKFDIARKVQVFSTAIEFVELKLTGCEIQRHTVQIPTELLVGDIDSETKKQLKAGFNIIEKSSSLSGDSIRNEVNKIRKDYTKSIPKYGNILLKSNKTKFNEEITKLKESVKTFQLEVKENLEAEISKAKTNLAEMLVPAITNKPPAELKMQVINGSPTEEQVKKYIEIKLDSIFPKAEDITTAMSIECVIKAITYETISDDDFQKQILKVYPLIPWEKMFEEYNAAPEKNKLKPII